MSWPVNKGYRCRRKTKRGEGIKEETVLILKKKPLFPLDGKKDHKVYGERKCLVFVSCVHRSMQVEQGR